MGFTRVDNWLFDVVMPNASPNTFKVVSAVVRATAGWGKESKELTLDDFQKMTGIIGRSTTQNAVQDAIDCGYIAREKSGRGFAYSPKIVLQEGDATVPKSYHEQYQNRTDDSTEIVLPSIYKENNKEILNKDSDNNIPESTPLPTLLRHFTELTSFFPPSDSTPNFESKWQRPLLSILEKASGDVEGAKGTITQAIKLLRDKKYNVSSPFSIQTTAVNILSGSNGNGNGGNYLPLWKPIEAEIRRNGRRSEQKWDEITTKILRRAGGYTGLCGMSFIDAERAFSAAYQDTL